MKRNSRIFILPISLICIAISAYSCYLRYQTLQNVSLTEYADERASVPSQEQHGALSNITLPKSALPLQIERLQVPTVSLTAREQVKLLSQSAFGKPANKQITNHVISVIHQTRHICPALPPSKISYPFCYFW